MQVVKCLTSCRALDQAPCLPVHVQNMTTYHVITGSTSERGSRLIPTLTCIGAQYQTSWSIGRCHFLDISL
ncbi:hypothetical protein QZH41_007502 [Actinostola sp. cb2023]|nr:hypothetical protein QZH41_007502 [Actinostola sp. cb2023]